MGDFNLADLTDDQIAVFPDPQLKRLISEFEKEKQRRQDRIDREHERLKALNSELAMRKEEHDRYRRELQKLTNVFQEREARRKTTKKDDYLSRLIHDDVDAKREVQDKVRSSVESQLEETIKRGKTARKNELGIRIFDEMELMVDKPPAEQAKENKVIDTVMVVFAQNSESRSCAHELLEDACLYWGLSEGVPADAPGMKSLGHSVSCTGTGRGLTYVTLSLTFELIRSISLNATTPIESSMLVRDSCTSCAAAKRAAWRAKDVIEVHPGRRRALLGSHVSASIAVQLELRDEAICDRLGAQARVGLVEARAIHKNMVSVEPDGDTAMQLHQKTMITVHISPQYGARSQELSKLGSLARMSSPTSSSKRGWKLSQPRPAFLENLRAASLTSSTVIGGSTHSPTAHRYLAEPSSVEETMTTPDETAVVKRVSWMSITCGAMPFFIIQPWTLEAVFHVLPL
ncbi:unnamed protein product [Prorocentrum cordatum]|uniref:Cilia- and flagella-associated protein 157 n=1 Tax=Prorocentrum cordatum TaxID=2364126 RepID=A0ABN9VPH2_9DINO|nr:unnamed protein product [Polarella glacialis]